MALLGIQLSHEIVLLDKRQCRTSRNNALPSCGDVLRDCPGRFLSLTSLICWYFCIRLLTTVWFRPSRLPIFLHDNSALLIPIICHLVAMDSFERTIRLLLSTKWKLFSKKNKSIKLNRTKTWLSHTCVRIPCCTYYLCGFLNETKRQCGTREGTWCLVVILPGYHH